MALPYVVIDIETGNASEDLVKRAVSQLTPPSNYKDPEKITKFLEEAAEKVRERSALLDGAPITAWATVCGKFRGAESGPAEPELLAELRKVLDDRTGPETTIVGHNHRSFDLPRLRAAYVRRRLALPMILRVTDDEEKRVHVYDTMRNFRFFTSERHEERYISLADVIEFFGLPEYKGGISGKDMPKLAAKGEWATIREYCLLDAVATEAVYLLMTSAHVDMK